MTDNLLQGLQENLELGISEQDVAQLRRMLLEEFVDQPSQDKKPIDLWRAMLVAADDPEKTVLPEWMATGFPLGIVSDIQYVGVFPSTNG